MFTINQINLKNNMHQQTSVTSNLQLSLLLPINISGC